MAYKSHDSSEIENNQLDKIHCSARRKVLKAALAGGALTAAHVLPGTWIKPVIDFITVPAHAQTSLPTTTPTPTTTTTPLPCGCTLSGIGVNYSTNKFSALYTWTTCSNIAETRMVITGPGVANPLGYVQPTSNPSGSRSFSDLSPYNATVFQARSTYTFTVTVEDAGNNVLSTCIDTFTT